MIRYQTGKARMVPLFQQVVVVLRHKEDNAGVGSEYEGWLGVCAAKTP